MTFRVLVLNGPNLGRLGVREPEVYGTASFADLVSWCAQAGARLDLEVDVRQTQSESELVGWVYEAIDTDSAVVVNPAAFTHYSWALRDALAQLRQASIEVHLSNVAARGRELSVVSAVVTGTVAGFGFDSYRLALEAVAAIGRRP